MYRYIDRCIYVYRYINTVVVKPIKTHCIVMRGRYKYQKYTLAYRPKFWESNY